MADGVLSGLTRRAEHWREEAEDRAESYGRHGWRRARRGSEDAAAELRRLWSRIEEIMEREVAPAASGGARRTAALASDYARAAGETTSDYARTAGEAATDYARRARRAVAVYGPQAREVAEHAALSVRDTARAHPLLAAGLLVGATWLVASMLSGSRRR